jgi:hypothetical protein
MIITSCRGRCSCPRLHRTGVRARARACRPTLSRTHARAVHHRQKNAPGRFPFSLLSRPLSLIVQQQCTNQRNRRSAELHGRVRCDAKEARARAAGPHPFRFVRGFAVGLPDARAERVADLSCCPPAPRSSFPVPSLNIPEATLLPSPAFSPSLPSPFQPRMSRHGRQG